MVKSIPTGSLGKMETKQKIRNLFAKEISELNNLVFSQDIVTLSTAWTGLEERFNNNSVTAESKIDQTNDTLCVLFSNIRTKLNAMSFHVSEMLSSKDFQTRFEALEAEGEDAEEALVELLDDIGKENATNLISDLKTLDPKSELSVEPFDLSSTIILSTWGDDLFRSIPSLDLDLEHLMDLEEVTSSTLDNFCLDDEGLGLLSELHSNRT